MCMRGCGSGQYSTLTRAHTYLNLWALLGPVPRPIKRVFTLPIVGIFYGYSLGLSPIVIPNYIWRNRDSNLGFFTYLL